MNRQQRRAAGAGERKVRNSANAIGRQVDRKLEAFRRNDMEAFFDDLFELVEREGFDEALQSRIAVYATRYPDFDSAGFLMALMDEASSCFSAEGDGSATCHHGALFAVPVSGIVGDIADAWKNGELGPAVERMVFEGGIADRGSRFAFVPVLVDIVTALDLTPGRMARLNRYMTQAVVEGREIERTLPRWLLGSMDIMAQNRNAFGGWLLLAVQVQEVPDDDSDLPLSVDIQDPERLYDVWDRLAGEVLPRGVTSEPPTDVPQAAVELGISRIEMSLLVAARRKGFDTDRMFDEIVVRSEPDVVWVSAVIDGTTLGPVDCPAAVVMYDSEQFHDHFLEFAHSVRFVENAVPSPDGLTVH